MRQLQVVELLVSRAEDGDGAGEGAGAATQVVGEAQIGFLQLARARFPL